MVKLNRNLPSTIGGLFLLASVSTGCGSNSQSSVSAPSLDPNEMVMLQGAGASFPAPLYQKWISEYTTDNNQENIRIKYDSVGSGAGVKKFLSSKC